MKKFIYLFLFTAFLFNQDYSLSFDGDDDFISLDTSIEINDIEGFSIMAKVLPKSTSNDHFKVIFDVSDWEQNNDNSGADRITLSMSEDMKWCLDGHGDNNISQPFSVCTNQDVELNQWAEILVTVDFSNSNLKIFIDGELAGESYTNIQNIYINETSNSSSKRIGQRIFSESNTGSNFHGLIDYIVFFKEVIDVNNINSSTIIDNNPYLNYSFEEPSGDVAYDYANSKNGTINGAAWVLHGCTDPSAINFDSEANMNDGSCEYIDNGDYSLYFDGIDDWVEMPDFGYLDNVTLEIWCAPTGDFNNFKGLMGTPRWWESGDFHWTITNGNLTFDIHYGAGVLTEGIQGDYNFNEGMSGWTHLALSYQMVSK